MITNWIKNYISKNGFQLLTKVLVYGVISGVLLVFLYLMISVNSPLFSPPLYYNIRVNQNGVVEV